MTLTSSAMCSMNARGQRYIDLLVVTAIGLGCVEINTTSGWLKRRAFLEKQRQ